jgi:GNAT superfamily N-acetyltransferase
MRSRGVGTTLVGAAANWFRNEGTAAIEVGTQLPNVAAARLYEACGFRLVSGAVSFRMMIGS